MPGEATIEPEDGGEIDFHPEGVALFTPHDSCYGMSLNDIIQEIKPEITNYGDKVVIEPHDGYLSYVIGGDADDHRLLLENSIWLIDCDCIIREALFNEFKHLIRTFPWGGNAIIWVDEDIHDLSADDETSVENISTKPDVVYEKQRLLDKVRDYLEYKANPTFTSEGIIEWQKEVHRIQKSLG